jgi:hypothetical protein
MQRVEALRKRQETEGEEDGRERRAPADVPAGKSQPVMQRQDLKRDDDCERRQQEGKEEEQAKAPGMAELAGHAALANNLPEACKARRDPACRVAGAQPLHQLVMVEDMDACLRLPAIGAGADIEGNIVPLGRSTGRYIVAPDGCALPCGTLVPRPVRCAIKRFESGEMQHNPLIDEFHSVFLLSGGLSAPLPG